ncbi:MAG: TetR family transcriptional regulator [Alphaproteobacteria bacterium]|nr:TetR family transcriptional regulator [Alphaproteobacteria bacterium]
MENPSPEERGAPAGRRASRDVRRVQLIEATITVLARRGYSALTIADVARQAGLSLGIVNFHFASKERLLAECLRHLAGGYRQTWMAAMEAAGPDPARRLAAMLLADFDPASFTSERLAAWIAFWGETQGRPTYDEICGAFDAERLAANTALCRELAAAGPYAIDAALAARTLEALGDGLWYGMVSASGKAGDGGAETGRRAVRLALAAFFPHHFKMPEPA